MRSWLDAEHPCLAPGCGALWRVTERSIHVEETGEPVGWAPVTAECSRGVAAHDLGAYNRGLEERASRGWSV
jgi:hypothetical protein